MQTMLSQRYALRRGSTLIVALMIIAFVTLIAFAIVKMGSTEADAGGAKRRYDHAVSCSDAARDLLLSQFKVYSISPTSLTLNQVIDDQTMASAHYNNVAVKSVNAAGGFTSQTRGAKHHLHPNIPARVGGQNKPMNLVFSKSAPK